MSEAFDNQLSDHLSEMDRRQSEPYYTYFRCRYCKRLHRYDEKELIDIDDDLEAVEIFDASLEKPISFDCGCYKKEVE